MTADDLSPHSPIARVLSDLCVPVSASEAHGMLCGLLCGLTSTLAKQRWFTELLDAAGLAASDVNQHAGALRLLDEWFGNSITALNDPEFGFQPLLPDDTEDTRHRLQALGEFCAGFAYGIGIGVAGRSNQALPEDSRELLGDFQAIESGAFQSDTEAVPDSAEEDAELEELVEYVRVGVLLIHEELRPVQTPASARSAPGLIGSQPDVH